MSRRERVKAFLCGVALCAAIIIAVFIPTCSSRIFDARREVIIPTVLVKALRHHHPKPPAPKRRVKMLPAFLRDQRATRGDVIRL